MGFNFYEMYVISKNGKRIDIPRSKFSDMLAGFFALPHNKRYLIA